MATTPPGFGPTFESKAKGASRLTFSAIRSRLTAPHQALPAHLRSVLPNGKLPCDLIEGIEDVGRYDLRAPRTVPLSFDWRRFAALRLGLVMRKVPLP